jgi:hypothetical protein
MIKNILKLIRRLFMPRKSGSGSSSRGRKKPVEESLSYEFDELTESEKALAEAQWSPSLLQDLEAFRRKHNITPEVIEERRRQGFNIADVVSLEVTGIHSDALEVERLQGSFHALAESEDQMGLVRQLELARRENERLKNGDAIVLPVSRSQIVGMGYWCRTNISWIIAGLLGVSLIWAIFLRPPSTPQQTPAQPTTQKPQN